MSAASTAAWKASWTDLVRLSETTCSAGAALVVGVPDAQDLLDEPREVRLERVDLRDVLRLAVAEEVLPGLEPLEQVVAHVADHPLGLGLLGHERVLVLRVGVLEQRHDVAAATRTDDDGVAIAVRRAGPSRRRVFT